jgi:hypothetical protein
MPYRVARPLSLLVATAVLALGGVMMVGAPAFAAEVSAANESQLADAIADANTTSGADVVRITASFALTADLPQATDDLTVVADAGVVLDAAGHAAFAAVGAPGSPVRLTVTGVAVTDATTAIAGTDAILEITGAAITGSTVDAVRAVDGDVTIDGSDIEGAPTRVSGSGIVVTITDTSFLDVHGTGLLLDLEDGSSATITGVTVDASTESDLGATVADSTLTVRDSTFSDSTGLIGVQLIGLDGATVELTRLVANGNDEGGLSISSADDADDRSTVTLADVTADGNHGPGLFVGLVGADVVVERSTFSRGSGADGIGVLATWQDDSTLTLVDSTVSGNSGILGGIGIQTSTSGHFSLLHSTVQGNASSVAGAAGGLVMFGVPFTISHSILSGNTSAGVAADLGFLLDDGPGTVDHSLVTAPDSATSTHLAAGAGNLSGVAANLGPLADNGGLTQTHLPLEGSPAIDAGDPLVTGAPATDQRGLARISGVIDIGSVELQQEAPALAATGTEAALPIVGGILLLGLGGLLLAAVRRRPATR